MRILLSKSSKFKLFSYLKEKYNAKNLKDLSQKLRISANTLNQWLYNKKRYLSSDFIPKNLDLEIIDKKPDNWGNIKGGKRTYKVLIKKYGEEEIRKRQINGGKVSLLKRNKKERENFKVDINDPLFLKFYGALLGDGWLSYLSYNYKFKRSLWWVGISGHAQLDKQYLMFLKNIIEDLFNKKTIIKYKKNSKGMEILFCHKQLILFMNKELNFPIGKKKNLVISNKFDKSWDKMKLIIKGIFDTDGSLYFDKTPAMKPYPIISIHMKAPVLLRQIHKHLLSKDFKVRLKDNDELILKGSEQVNKWMKEIGSDNPKHLLKYNNWSKSPRGATG